MIQDDGMRSQKVRERNYVTPYLAPMWHLCTYAYAYIHLNPVTAGVVKDAAKYRWCGHREVIGRAVGRQPPSD